jgi:hypothetical protein
MIVKSEMGGCGRKTFPNLRFYSDMFLDGLKTNYELHSG